MIRRFVVSRRKGLLWSRSPSGAGFILSPLRFSLALEAFTSDGRSCRGSGTRKITGEGVSRDVRLPGFPSPADAEIASSAGGAAEAVVPLLARAASSRSSTVGRSPSRSTI